MKEKRMARKSRHSRTSNESNMDVSIQVIRNTDKDCNVASNQSKATTCSQNSEKLSNTLQIKSTASQMKMSQRLSIRCLGPWTPSTTVCPHLVESMQIRRQRRRILISSQQRSVDFSVPLINFITLIRHKLLNMNSQRLCRSLDRHST